MAMYKKDADTKLDVTLVERCLSLTDLSSGQLATRKSGVGEGQGVEAGQEAVKRSFERG